MHPRGGRQIQFLPRLHIERRVPAIDIADLLGAEFAGGMHIDQDLLALVQPHINKAVTEKHAFAQV